MFCTFLSSHESILVDYDLQESWWQFDPMLCGLFQFCVMISRAIAGALLLKLEPIVVEFIRSSWNLRFPFKRFIYLPIDTYLVYICSSEIRPRVDFLLTFFQLKVLQPTIVHYYEFISTAIWFIFLRQLWQEFSPLFVIYGKNCSSKIMFASAIFCSRSNLIYKSLKRILDKFSKTFHILEITKKKPMILFLLKY